jgi:hypothetical protein
VCQGKQHLAPSGLEFHAYDNRWFLMFEEPGPHESKSASELERCFTDIYLTNGFLGGDSISGPGSDLAQTETLREALPGLLKYIGVRTMLDAACGDFFWMKAVHLDLDRYIGTDIVAALIAQNNRIYADSCREFRVLDLTRDPLPKADLILCRDCLVHLPLATIGSAIRNFKRSGAKYLLTTTFPERADNPDIPAGYWRTINLQAPPFGFPEPDRMINEQCPTEGYSDKSLALWRLDSLPDDLDLD